MSVSKKMEIRTFNWYNALHGFTYLGLPRGVFKPRVEDFLPLVHMIERTLTCTSLFLSQVEKLELVISMFSALPTFYMCTLKITAMVVKQMDMYRKHCLWRGNDINAKKPPLAAWSMIAKPKSKGGLGVIKFETQNDTLLMKYLNKLYNNLISHGYR